MPTSGEGNSILARSWLMARNVRSAMFEVRGSISIPIAKCGVRNHYTLMFEVQGARLVSLVTQKAEGDLVHRPPAQRAIRPGGRTGEAGNRGNGDSGNRCMDSGFGLTGHAV